MNELLDYRTIAKESEGFFKDKGSKFLAYGFPVSSVEEVKQHLTLLKEKEYAARHFCYAYRIGADGSTYRANDDGEPAHSAGDPILGQIDSYELTEVLVVVVRYFGGTKLGIGGLINAYRTATKDCFDHSEIITKCITQRYKLQYEYPDMNTVMRYVKQYQADIIHQKLELSCEMTVELSKEKASGFEEKILATRKIGLKKV